MFETTVAVLLPFFFVMAVGYVARRSGRLDAHQTAGINRVLVEFTLPATLFVGTFQTPRAVLLGQAPMLLALLLAFAGMWLIALFVARRLFRHDVGTSALQATMLAFPNTGFIGVPLMVGIFGASSVVTVALATVLGTILFIPGTMILLELVHDPEAVARNRERGTIWHGGTLATVVNVVRAPLVWAPLVGAAMVLLGIGLPQIVLNMLNLLGSITAGLAMFAAGIALAAYPLRLNFEIGTNAFLKMIVQPLLMLGVLSVLSLGGLRAQEALLICALPTGILMTVLAERFKTYQAEASSTLILTSLLLLVTLPLWRWIAP